MTNIADRNMSIEKPERLYFWDNAKGTLIFLVVFGHFLYPYRTLPEVKTIFDTIYLFHMPAFVFVSGYLSRMVSDSKTSILKLFVAYTLFNFPMMVYAVLFEDMAPSLLIPYYSYWYLLALIAWRLMAPILSKMRGILLLSAVASILIGFVSEINNVLSISRIIGFLPFFLTGYVLNQDKLREFFGQRKGLHSCLGLFLLAIIFYLSAHLSRTGIILSDLVFFPYEAADRIIFRLFMLLISFSVIISLGLILPCRPVRLLTSWGRNSLGIYVLHRFVTIFAYDFFSVRADSVMILKISFIGTVSTLFVLGLNGLNYKLSALLGILAESISTADKTKNGLRAAFYVFMLCQLIFVISHNISFKKEETHSIICAEQNAQINQAISIAFVGDLILLRDQVRTAYSAEKQDYDFSPIFSYAQKHLLNADFSIGVLEGPLAGKERGYSTSNYEDGIPLYLNFPDTFADSIKNAGIDLVTLANNHILDMGLEGAERTLDILNTKKIETIGSYRNLAEKNKIRVIEVKGLRIAVLAYSYPSNYYSEGYFFEQNVSLTSVIVDRNSPYFKMALANVRNDFDNAKAEKPDLIIVLPHMGTQFINKTDKFQKTWNEIFIHEGADIILGDHSHAVQPIEFRTVNENGCTRQVLIVNSPGNFVNSYTDHNGDATSIVKVFIDSEQKSVLCAGIIPMYTYATHNGQHCALPIYDIVFNKNLQNKLSMIEMKRVREVHALVTKVMLGTELTLDQAQSIYYLFPEGYRRQSVIGIDLNNEPFKTNVLEMFKTAKNALFIGDSVTHGTKNGGYGWYEPLTTSLPALHTEREAWGGATTFTLLDNLDKILSHNADLYIIAIGTNDIRYRDAAVCAMTPQQYIDNLEKLSKAILKIKPEANLIFVSPWPSLANDPFIKISADQKETIYSSYTKALKIFCQQNGHVFVNPATDILAAIDERVSGYYLIDHIHPNADKGLRLYSEAFIKSADKL